MAPRTALAQKTHIASTSSSTAMTWAEFASNVNNGTTYAGVTVYLDEDITATTMAGINDTICFQGTFEGNGNTITFNHTNNAGGSANWYHGLFRYLNGATIQNLKVNGTITTNAARCGGLAGHCYGDNTITNCLSDITINSSLSSDGTYGGFVSIVRTGTTTFEGCAFTGRLLGSGTYKSGGLVGSTVTTVVFNNCIFDPTEVTIGLYNSATFSREFYPDSSVISINNSYYTYDFNDGTVHVGQGKQMYTITGQSPVSVAMDGAATNHNVSHITAYSGTPGLLYDGTVIAGEGDPVSLNLDGYDIGYVADHGTLTGTANPYTLTMEASNTVISPMPCPQPTDLTVAGTTATTATLQWTVDGNPTAWQICLNDDETNLIEADSNPFTLTGLTTSQFYTAKVRTNCGDAQSDWSNSVTFTATDKTIVGSGTAKNDFLPCDNYARYCVTQQIYTPAELDGAGKILSLDFYKVGTTNCTRSISIYMVHTPKDAFENNTDWIPVTVADRVFYGTVNFADNAWTTITLNTPFNYNGIDNLALVVDDNTGMAGSRIYFKSYVATLNQSIYQFSDDGDIDPTGTIGPCYGLFPSTNKSQMLVGKTYPTPTAMSSSTVRYTTTFLSWTEYGTATSWQICIDNDETNLIEANSNPFCLKNLSPGTTYTAKVRATYGDEHSDWSEPISFTTLAAIEVPYSYTFSFSAYWICQSSPEIHDKWTIVSGLTPECFTDTHHHPHTNNDHPHTNNPCLYLPAASTLGGELPVIAMPYFPDNIGNYTLEFWAYLGDYPYIGGTLDVGFLTDLYDPSTFVPVRIIDYTYYIEHAESGENDYAKVSVNFENVPDRAYIAFRGTVESGYCYWCVDDVSLTMANQPLDLTFQNIAATSAELHWNGPLNAENYSIRVEEIQKNLIAEYFDNPSAPHYDYDWTIVNGHQYTGVYSNDIGRFYFYSSSNTQYLISPELIGLQDDMRLLISIVNYNHKPIQVGYSSTDMDTTSFTFGEQLTSYVIDYDELIPPGTKYFCIKVLPGEGQGQVILSDITVGYPEVYMYFYFWNHTEQHYLVNNGSQYHNIFTLTGLQPDYEYVVNITLRSNGQFIGNLAGSFRTPLDFYSTDFDSICDWTLINGSCANAWSWGTAANNGGTHGLYISNDGGTTNAYTNTSSAMVYATKTLDLEAGAYHFSFDWKANGQSSYDYLRVALVPAAVNLQAGTSKPSGFGVATLPTGWIALDGGSKLNSSTEWQTVGNDIMVPTDGTYKMVLAWWNNSSGGSNPPAAIDNVSICNIACPKPFNLTVGELSPTTASLHWDGPATTGSYTIRYRTVGTYIWQTKTVEGGNTHVTGAISGLSPETQYEAQVQGDCGNALWSETVSFTTEAYDYLLDSDFDSACEWTLINGSCANAWAWGNAAGNNSTNGLYISYDGGVTYACNYLEPSVVYAASNTLALEDGWYHYSYDYRCGRLSNEDYMRAALVPASVQLEADTVPPDGLGSYSLPSGWIPLDGGLRLYSSNNWYSFDADIYVPASGNYRVVCVWINSSNTQNNNTPGAVDNFKAYALPCATPFNFTVNNVTTTTAELNWTGTTGMDSYTVRYRPYTYSQPVVEESFENGHDDWTLIMSDGYSDWTQDVSHSGQWSFEFHFSIENHPSQYLITPELSDVTEGMKLEFYVKNANVQLPNPFYVGFSSTDNATGSFAFGNRITAPGEDWNLYSFDIPAGTKYICFKCDYSNSYWNTLYLDDIYVGVVSPNQAWQTMAVEGNAIDMGATLTGLIPNTRYEVQVKTGCEAGEWTRSLIFATGAATTQTIALQAGWNWVSFNVETTLNDLKAALVNALPGASSITIKSKKTYSTYNGHIWRGTLNSLDIAQMYKVNVPANCEITLAGIRVNPSEHPVTINFGANWIGFPLNTSMSLTNAFAGFAVTGDMVKSKNQYSSYNGSKWRGNISTLQPGQGYIYKSAASGNRVFTW